LPQVVETAVGTPVRTLLGPLVREAQAVLVGGTNGTWVPAGRALGSRWDAAELGVPLGGARVLTALPSGRCGLDETMVLLRRQARCCGAELPRIVAALADLTQPGAFDTVVRWSTQSATRGGCRHTNDAARLLLSALAAFPAAFEAHAAGECAARRSP
jgi:hypothetical protein